MEQAVYTIPEYCVAEKISRSKRYDEWAKGEGVEFFRRGARILISHEARIRHRKKLEREERKAREERGSRSAAAADEQAA